MKYEKEKLLENTKKELDKHYLSNLFIYAMGSRTQKEFAELIGISKETANRIVKENYGSPLNKETLKKIAAHSEGRVRLCDLLIACGYKPTYSSPDIRYWREENINSIRNFIKEFLDGTVMITDASMEETYNLLYAVNDSAAFTMSDIKDYDCKEYPECESYRILMVTWENRELKVRLLTYIMLLGYVKRDGRFCTIHAVTEPKSIAMVDRQMKGVFEMANDAMLHDGLNVYDETLYDELTYFDASYDEPVQIELFDTQVAFLKEILSRTEILDTLDQKEKNTAENILKRL